VSTVAGNNGAADVTFKSVSLSGFSTQVTGSSASEAVCAPASGAIQTGRGVLLRYQHFVSDKCRCPTPYWHPVVTPHVMTSSAMSPLVCRSGEPLSCAVLS
jgi:hypothetical protein